MKWNKEDVIKIKQLIKSDDETNVKLGCILAINTLGMSIDELIDLIDADDIEVINENKREQYWKLYVFKATFYDSSWCNILTTYKNHKSIKEYIMSIISN